MVGDWWISIRFVILCFKVRCFGATATSTGRDVMMCALLRMLLLTTLPSCFTGEKCLRMRRDINHVDDFRQSHWLRDKIPAKCCQHERRNDSFFVSGSVVILLPL